MMAGGCQVSRENGNPGFMTCVALSPGQTHGPTPSSPGTSTPITPTGCDNGRLTAPQQTGGWLVSGKVVMEDGAPPPAPVSVEVFCSGVAGMSGFTNPKGGFSLSPDSTLDVGLGNPCAILPQGAGSESVAHSGTAAGECLLHSQACGHRQWSFLENGPDL
jgi:hypothetical protein